MQRKGLYFKEVFKRNSMSEAWLLALSGAMKGDVVPLEHERLTIGRSSDNDLLLSEPTVSRLHATIQPTDRGWTLKDANSKAGTYVNGFRTADAMLHHGDLLDIGPHRFRFEISDNGLPRGRQTRHAQTFYEKAMQLASAGQMEEALIHYEKCVVLDPGRVGFRLELGKAYEKSGTWLKAKACFQKALTLDEKSADAKEALSRIEERIRIYAKQSSLLFGKQERPDLGEWVTLRSDHFEIRFHIGHEQTRERQIYRALERAYERVGEHLNDYPDRTQVEILATRQEAEGLAEKEGIPLEPWMAGFYDGKVLRILITDETLPDPHFPLISIVHEYTHLVCDRLTRGRCPAWLSEGLALYESQNLPDAARERLREALSTDALLPFQLLENNFAALRYDELINLAYAQSFSVTEFLVTKHGWAGMRAFLGALNESECTEQALGRLGWTYGGLEKAWKAPLARADMPQM